MAMRKSSRISAKKSLDSLDDIGPSEPSPNSSINQPPPPTTNGIESAVTNSSSSDTSSINNNNNNSTINTTVQNNGDNTKCTTDNGAIDIDLPLLEEVTEKAVIVTKELPPETLPVPPFELIDGNIYHCDRRREPKDVRRLTCMCELSKSQLAKGKMGCGEDCLNRMMMIECGSRCKLGDNCSNKRFQRREYCKIQPFQAGKKGWGIRALQDIQGGVFVMEYVGEVIDPEEFMGRVEKYAKKGMVHHYFMALSADEIIDATIKGNATRFTNHSCEPNCEIQKWTISGEFRMGLFSLKPIKRGDELSIDYKFQRYGKVAQKCFCETSSCRGYIGSSEASDIYIDGSKRNKNDENNSNNSSGKQRENSQDSSDDGKDCKDGFRIPRLVGPKRPSESSDGHVNDSSNGSSNSNSSSSYTKDKDLNGSNNISRKNYSDLSSTASLLLPVKKYRNDQQPSQPVDPNQAEQMKLSKEAFRMQFELNELRRQKEEEKLDYLRQIEFMKQEIARSRSLGGFIDGQSPYFPPPLYHADEPLISWDSHFSHPPDDQNSALHPALANFGEASYSTFNDQIDYDLYAHFDPADSLPILTNGNTNHNVLVELTSKEHKLMPDEKAVIHTDYGIEYVPMVKRRKCSISKSLFDPSFPPPGIYYECVIENSVYYVPYPFDSQNYPLDFFATTAQASWPDFEFLSEPIFGPLPRYWRRACDPKTNRVYYYNIRSGNVSWHFPTGSGMKRKLPFNTGPIGLAHKIESIIASADSTSTPPPSLSVNATSMVTTASQSPPGIFAISNGIEKDSKKSQQAEPDQSMPKKSKQMVFDGRTKKGLEKFKEEITELVKKALNPYRKPDCKVGRIDNNEDFKFLARKLTHEVYLKETNSGKIELVINETVKTKARNYIKKYMASKGPVFKTSSSKGEKFRSDVLLSDLESNFTEGQTVVNGSTSVPNEINGNSQQATPTTTSISVKSSSASTATTTTSDSSICVVNGETSQEVNDV